MLENEITGVGLPPASKPVGQQRRVAPAGFAQDSEAAAVVPVAGISVEPLEVSVAAHVERRPAAPGIGFVITVFSRPDVRHFVGRELGVDGCREIGQDERGKRRWVCVVFVQGDLFF